MSTLSFEYKIVPYKESNLSSISGFKLLHTDDTTDVLAIPYADDEETTTLVATNTTLRVTYDSIGEESVQELEETFRQIYYYDQSYFVARVDPGVFNK